MTLAVRFLLLILLEFTLQSSPNNQNDFLKILKRVPTKDPMDRRIGRIIAKSQKTKTAISFQTATSVVPLTCALSNAVTTACLKRRRRRTTPLQLQSSDNELGLIDLSPSLKKNDRKGRLAVTVWRTSTSVFTTTTTSTNSLITFSVSFLCTINGLTVPGLCAG